MKFRLLFLLAGVIGLVGLQATPASAETAPPPASSCVATVQAVEIDDPASLVSTAGLMSVNGVVTCKLNGVLTDPPASYADLPYKGSIVAGALISGQGQPCVGTPSGYFYAAGPTLVMATTAICQFPLNEPPGTVHFPIVWWSTESFSGANKTNSQATGPVIAP